MYTYIFNQRVPVRAAAAPACIPAYIRGGAIMYVHTCVDTGTRCSSTCAASTTSSVSRSSCPTRSSRYNTPGNTPGVDLAQVCTAAVEVCCCCANAKASASPRYHHMRSELLARFRDRALLAGVTSTRCQQPSRRWSFCTFVAICCSLCWCEPCCNSEVLTAECRRRAFGARP